eukprot:9101764-Ditylum_brightwellii.AAC.1
MGFSGNSDNDLELELLSSMMHPNKSINVFTCWLHKHALHLYSKGRTISESRLTHILSMAWTKTISSPFKSVMTTRTLNEEKKEWIMPSLRQKQYKTIW